MGEARGAKPAKTGRQAEAAVQAGHASAPCNDMPCKPTCHVVLDPHHVGAALIGDGHRVTILQGYEGEREKGGGAMVSRGVWLQTTWAEATTVQWRTGEARISMPSCAKVAYLWPEEMEDDHQRVARQGGQLPAAREVPRCVSGKAFMLMHDRLVLQERGASSDSTFGPSHGDVVP